MEPRQPDPREVNPADAEAPDARPRDTDDWRPEDDPGFATDDANLLEDDPGDAELPDADADADADADFAGEHSSSTFADEMPGGPEGVKEPESPTGRGGDGGMDLS